MSILCCLFANNLALSILIPFLPIAIRLLVLSAVTVAIFLPDCFWLTLTDCTLAVDKGVEIIELDDDPIQFIKNLLSPAKVQSVQVSQKQSGEKIATVTADNTNKRIAIGKNGINIERAKLLANRQHNIDNIVLK